MYGESQSSDRLLATTSCLILYIVPVPLVPVRSVAFQVDDDINGNQVPVRPAVVAKSWQDTRAPSSPPISPLVRLVLDAKIVNASLPDTSPQYHVLVGVAVGVLVGVFVSNAGAVLLAIAVAVLDGVAGAVSAGV